MKSQPIPVPEWECDHHDECVAFAATQERVRVARDRLMRHLHMPSGS